ncbi:MAG: LuxR C-terminal-related transcriptional regulator [Muribaculaceae bacterium]|nr:LuxR C-terminal-related transcriptional regulator [Muribaculaceae bacterium]MDE7188887.1 LuxR C-terminal-related transcriptional regulator [Muribaculaceae bacterium]
MMSTQSVRLAIIGLSTLEMLGLRELAQGVGIICVDGYSDLSELGTDTDRYDLYAVGTEQFVAHIGFFMPKHGRVLMISDESGRGQTTHGIVHSDSTEEEIRCWLERMIHALAQEGNTPCASLSQREVEVLRHIASGLTNKEIADALCISANTVITHRKNISAKLGIRSVSGLSLYAMKNGLV